MTSRKENKHGSESDTTEDADACFGGDQGTGVFGIEVLDAGTLQMPEDTAVEAPLPQILKEAVEVDELAQYERVQQQIVEVPMPQISKGTVEEVKASSHEQVSTRIFQKVDVPVDGGA